jgi:hypothetical protein
LPLGGGEGADGEGVEAFAELVGEGGVHGAVAFEEGLVVEGRADDEDLEVGLGAWSDAVHVALVDDVDVSWLEGLRELVEDAFLPGHEAKIPP